MISVNEKHLGADLLLSHKATMGSALHLAAAGGDLEIVAGLDNLAQAIWLRLAVHQGDLEHLGHPDYGSRLYLLIGRRLIPETIALAKAYIHEALRRERRIASIQRVDVLPDPTRPDSLLIEVTVQPVGAAVPLQVSGSLDISPGARAAAEANAREA